MEARAQFFLLVKLRRKSVVLFHLIFEGARAKARARAFPFRCIKRAKRERGFETRVSSSVERRGTAVLHMYYICMYIFLLRRLLTSRRAAQWRRRREINEAHY